MEIEASIGQHTRTRLVEVELEDGTTFYIKALVPPGESEVKGGGKIAFEEAMKAVEGIGKRLNEAWKTVKPGKASVELNIDFTWGSGKVMAVLLDGSVQAGMKVTLEWGSDSAKEREFLRFIERTFKISQQPDPKSGKRGLDAFSNKTVLFEYAGDYQKGMPVRPFKEIHDVLSKNRNQCALFGDFASALRELEAEYEKNAASLEPLKDHLRATDELIDQIVYRLYGLNDEEIALVEGMK